MRGTEAGVEEASVFLRWGEGSGGVRIVRFATEKIIGVV